MSSELKLTITTDWSITLSLVVLVVVAKFHITVAVSALGSRSPWPGIEK